MENNEKQRGNGVLLGVIWLATFLVAVVGVTFAYFSVIADISEQSLEVTTANPAQLQYLGGNEVSLENALPGDTTVPASGLWNSFTVENPSSGTISQTYDLTLYVDEDEFTNVHEAVADDPNDQGYDDSADGQLILTMALACESGTVSNSNMTFSGCENSNYVLDLTNGSSANGAHGIVDDLVIEPGETQTYFFKLEFINTGVNQDENKGASLSAHIIMDDVRPVSANRN